MLFKRPEIALKFKYWTTQTLLLKIWERSSKFWTLSLTTPHLTLKILLGHQPLKAKSQLPTRQKPNPLKKTISGLKALKSWKHLKLIPIGWTGHFSWKCASVPPYTDTSCVQHLSLLLPTLTLIRQRYVHFLLNTSHNQTFEFLNVIGVIPGACGAPSVQISKATLTERVWCGLRNSSPSNWRVMICYLSWFNWRGSQKDSHH